MHQFVKGYVKGCGTCQATKVQWDKNWVPLHPIMTNRNAVPFETVACDLITDLPVSRGFDSVLMVMDHNCLKAVVFIPWNKTITLEGLATLYVQHVFPYYGVPKRLISDRDPRITTWVFQEICRKLKISQNMSTAYHPRTDRQAERTNQWLEQYLRIYANYQQDD